MDESIENSKKDISRITTYQSGVAQASAHRLIGRVTSDFLLEYGISKMEWFVLGLIYDAGQAGARVSHLMRQLDTTLPYITNTVNSLQSKGFITKIAHAGDSRIKLIRIADDKDNLVETIETGLRQRLRKELYRDDHITRNELTSYIRVLFKIIS